MKKDLHSILDELTPEELDTLPEELFQAEALDDVTFRRIQNIVAEQTDLSAPGTGTEVPPQAEPSGSTVIKTKRSLRTAIVAAACLVLLAGAGFGTCAYAAEQKEYKEAVEFFEEHDLSTEGLTRREIKAVYRDITTNAFTYSKTAEVIENTKFDTSVPGFEISPILPTPTITPAPEATPTPTPKPIATAPVSEHPVKYKYDTTLKKDKELGEYVIDQSYIAKYHNGRFLWRTYLNEFMISGFSGDLEHVDAPVFVYGTERWTSVSESVHAWVVALDADGNVLWKTMQENDFESEYIDTVLTGDDGTHTVFSRGYTETGHWLCVSKYDTEGTLLHTEKTDIGNLSVWDVTPSETGYIVQLGDESTKEYAKIVKVDFNGVITDSFSYDSADCDYYITDILEHNGTIYLSGYSTPKADPAYNHTPTRDIFHIARSDSENRYRSVEEITDLFQNNFTALLLVCEPNTGTPKEFYSMQGALGDTLTAKDGVLCWQTENIVEAKYTWRAEGEVFSGNYYFTCDHHILTFHEDGSVSSQKQPDKTTKYER